MIEPGLTHCAPLLMCMMCLITEDGSLTALVAGITKHTSLLYRKSLQLDRGFAGTQYCSLGKGGQIGQLRLQLVSIKLMIHS